jgi:hypothetical protein
MGLFDGLDMNTIPDDTSLPADTYEGVVSKVEVLTSASGKRGLSITYTVDGGK